MKFSHHPPVPQLPDFHLVEAVIDGRKHTVAMVPRIMLPPEKVYAHAQLFAAAPELLELLEWARTLLASATPNSKHMDESMQREWCAGFGKWFAESGEVVGRLRHISGVFCPGCGQQGHIDDAICKHCGSHIPENWHCNKK